MDYDVFSDRLVDSINMVRELLLSNKEMREKEEMANQKVSLMRPGIASATNYQGKSSSCRRRTSTCARGRTKSRTTTTSSPSPRSPSRRAPRSPAPSTTARKGNPTTSPRPRTSSMTQASSQNSSPNSRSSSRPSTPPSPRNSPSLILPSQDQFNLQQSTGQQILADKHQSKPSTPISQESTSLAQAHSRIEGRSSGSSNCHT